MSTLAALVLLLATLAFAVVRPRGLPEATAAVPAAALAVLLGLVPARAAADELRQLAPTVAFLAAVLVLADLTERAGLFAALGARLVSASRGRPVPFLRLVFVIGSLVTAVLSLDATVVLLTPVVIGAAVSSRIRAAPPVYAVAHLANSASLLLPVSNLTNLMVFAAGGVSFARFGVLMAAPWLATLLVEYAILRRYFAPDLALAAPGGPTGVTPAALPRYPLAVLAATLVGFAVAPLAGLDPAAAAAAGAVALAVPALRSRSTSPRALLRAAAAPFLAFVLGLGVVVRAVQETGLGRVVPALVPDGSSLPALLAVAALAAVLANLVNNLPAVLVLLPALTAAGTPAMLAGLVGVNLGPNLTYAGSLATLLWRRLLNERDVPPSQAEFLRLGVRTVPLTLVAATVALWASIHLVGV